MNKSTILLIGILASSCFASEPGPNYEIVEKINPDNHFESLGEPHHDIVQEIYQRSSDDAKGSGFKIVLSSLADPSKKELLFAFDRDARASFSPDGRWIVIDDRPVRGHCEPRLFKLKEGLKFVEVKEAMIRQRAIEFFVKENKLPPDVRKNMIPEGACIVSSLQWAQDSNSLMLRLSKERTGEPVWIWSWFCIFDLKEQRISLDLNILNRGAFTLKK